MSILRAAFDSISESDIDQLVSDGIREGLLIEYKRDMYGNADADKREFLKDLSSFANSSGGHLLIGVDEAQGVPVAKAGYMQDAMRRCSDWRTFFAPALNHEWLGYECARSL